jgi:hypothetical protein
LRVAKRTLARLRTAVLLLIVVGLAAGVGSYTFV